MIILKKVTWEARSLGFTLLIVPLVKYIYQIDVSFLCVCPLIDHNHIVKVAVDPQTTLTM